jgi:transposase-like protein
MKLALDKQYGVCPFCGSGHTESIDEEIVEDKKTLFLDHFYCFDCEKQWDEVFIHVGFEKKDVNEE